MHKTNLSVVTQKMNTQKLQKLKSYDRKKAKLLSFVARCLIATIKQKQRRCSFSYAHKRVAAGTLLDVFTTFY